MGMWILCWKKRFYNNIIIIIIHEYELGFRKVNVLVLHPFYKFFYALYHLVQAYYKNELKSDIKLRNWLKFESDININVD